MARPWYALLLLPALAGCGEGEKHWTNPVMDVTCGTLKLHFEERVRETGAPAGARFFTPVLTMDDGQGPRTVDAVGSHDDPRAYQRLLPASMRYHAFDAGDARWSDRYHLRSWVLYADPAVIDETRYFAVASCLDANLPAIDAAWDRKRKPEDSWDVQTDRRFRISALLRAKHDWNQVAHAPAALGPRWTCPDGAFLKAVPEASLMQCVKEDSVVLRTLGSGLFCDSVGRIEDGGASIAFYPDGVLNPNLQKRVGPDRARYFGACRDDAGKGLLETITPVPWKDRR